jgi:nucleoside-diphosphate-sugar epimerase
VALAQDGDEIQVWGCGKQTLSFIYVDDCVEGICRIVRSDYPHPLNLGTDRLVTIDELVDIVVRIADKQIHKHYDPRKPEGVRGRNSGNMWLRQMMGWEPQVPQEVGLERTFRWIEGGLRKAGRIPAPLEVAWQ